MVRKMVKRVFFLLTWSREHFILKDIFPGYLLKLQCLFGLAVCLIYSAN